MRLVKATVQKTLNANSNQVSGERQLSSNNYLAPRHCYTTGTLISFPFVIGKLP